MKKLLLVTIAIMTIFAGCKKEDDNYNKVEFIAGEWGGNEYLGSGKMYVKIEKDGKFTYQSGNGQLQTGKCSFLGDQTAGTATAKFDNGTEETWYISGITSTTMTFVRNNVMFNLTSGGQPNSTSGSGNVNGGGSGGSGKNVCSSCEGTGVCSGITGCHGTLKCWLCYGRGGSGKKGTAYWVKCKTCNGTGVCNNCNGTGKCKYCKGTGYKN